MNKKTKQRKLTKDQVLSIPDLISQGLTWKQVANRFNVSRKVIESLSKGATYKEFQKEFQKKMLSVRNNKDLGDKKICSICKEIFPKNTDYFPQYKRNGKYKFESRCRSCKNDQNKKRYDIIKLEVLNYYSNGTLECHCCKESIYEFLTIDHTEGGGKKHREEIRKGPGSFSSIHFWLKRNNFPEGFRVLCFNCNCSYGFYGYCPHNQGTKN